MRVLRLHALGTWGGATPPDLRLEQVDDPRAEAGQVLIAVNVCGVCRTELDEIEGRAAPSALPRILGHQVVGRVVERGAGVTTPKIGQRVGVAWIFSACGTCEWCLTDQENLCPHFVGTGRDVDGGYGELLAVPAAFVHELPEDIDDARLAPLLCAGAIGYRSLRLTGLLERLSKTTLRLGLTGFGASAHLVLRMVEATMPGLEVFVFARSATEREFARELGAVWAGDTSERAPAPLHAIIDTTPAHLPILEGLRNLAPGGRLVINAISKQTDDRNVWETFDYHRDLWMEREIKSVTNVTRRDVRDFVALAQKARLLPEVTEYPLEDAPRALEELKLGRIRGAKVLRIS